MRRLSRAGFKEAFVRPAILPEWWKETCDQDPDLLPDFEIRVARFLGLPVSSVRDSGTVLAAPLYPAAQLRRVRDVDRDRLAPAIHSAIQIAAATVRSLRDPALEPAVLPPDGLRWREKIERGGAVTLDSILGDLWQGGIPVVPLFHGYEIKSDRDSLRRLLYTNTSNNQCRLAVVPRNVSDNPARHAEAPRNPKPFLGTCH